MKAVVLSGGGSKGSYQIGVWKALRKLHISYDIVTGTSVGALNGALMVQKKFHKAMKLWKKINMKLLFGDMATDSSEMKDIINMYCNNFIKNGGMNVEILEELISKCIDTNSFYSSDIDYGLVTVNLSGKKAVQIRKNKIPKNKLVDYLMASASCYPAFQKKDIDGKKFIDGGMFDNLPINLAIEMGADEVIAVDLKAPGVKRRVKKKVPTITIKPNNKLTNFLNFNKQGSKRNILFGYYDTMKVFNRYYGKKYTFKKNKYDYFNNEYQEVFLQKVNEILNTEALLKIFSFNFFDLSSLFLKLTEDLGKLFNMEEAKLYKYRSFHKKILKKVKKKNRQYTRSQNNTIFIYNKIKENDLKYLRTKAILTPKEFLLALFLYVISEV